MKKEEERLCDRVPRIVAAITPQQFIVITVDWHEYLEAARYAKPIGLVICLCDFKLYESKAQHSSYALCTIYIGIIMTTHADVIKFSIHTFNKVRKSKHRQK